MAGNWLNFYNTATLMAGVVLAALRAAINQPLSERLAQFAGNWLQYAPGENAVVVRQPQPAGCPAFPSPAFMPCLRIRELPCSINPQWFVSFRDAILNSLKAACSFFLRDRNFPAQQESDFSLPVVGKTR